MKISLKFDISAPGYRTEIVLYSKRSYGPHLSDGLCPSFLNPVKGDVSDSHLNAGGGRFDHPLEINEGVP